MKTVLKSMAIGLGVAVVAGGLLMGGTALARGPGWGGHGMMGWAAANLTPEQQAKVQELRSRHWQDMAELRTKNQAEMAALLKDMGVEMPAMPGFGPAGGRGSCMFGGPAQPQAPGTN